MSLDDELVEEKAYREYVLANLISNGKNHNSAKRTSNIYCEELRALSKELFLLGKIQKNLIVLKNIDFLNELYNELLHGEGKLHNKNLKGNRRKSSAVKNLLSLIYLENSFKDLSVIMQNHCNSCKTLFADCFDIYALTTLIDNSFLKKKVYFAFNCKGLICYNNYVHNKVDHGRYELASYQQSRPYAGTLWLGYMDY